MTNERAIELVDKAIKSDFIGKCNVGYELAEALGIVVRLATNSKSSKDKWISIDEKSPEEDGYYLVTQQFENARFTNIAEYNHYCFCPWRKEGVTHWQHLPEPYKESEEK